MDAQLTQDILMLAAIVTSYVGVFKAYGMDKRHSHLVALVIASIFVLVPDTIQNTLVLISVIGLTASGVYNNARNKTEENK